ncbi:hypothetical protein HKBW3S09_01700, partial [Candidatus Hakubella thermalkaliphila]
YLIDKQDEVYRLSAVETNQLKDAIEQNLNAMGLYLEENPILPELEDEMETCPQCGSRASVKELLEKGCSECGWVSPKLKKRLAEVAVTTE